jgi:NIMA-interacting peptidyl-prolyl cis-trans isomerase 1
VFGCDDGPVSPRIASCVLVLLIACDEKKAENTAAPSATASAEPVASAAPSVTAPPVVAVVDAAPPESVACQHVLVAYKGAKNAPANVTRSKADAKARAEEVHKKALAGEDMAALAQTYSDDQGSRERLGSAGKFKRDGMVKPFSDAAFALKVNEISDVVETPFGFHVIKRNQ